MKIKTDHKRDLRADLIAAGEAILEEQGLRALTLRAIAARAGVSHAAPAHHFPEGLPGLRAAIAARGFARFSAAMLAEQARAAPEPRARLVGICRGYMTFAREQAPFFELIFGTVPMLKGDPDLAAESDRAYGILAEACAPFAPVGPHPRATETMIWSLVHGLALLTAREVQNGAGRADLPGIEDILPELGLREG